MTAAAAAAFGGSQPHRWPLCNNYYDRVVVAVAVITAAADCRWTRPVPIVTGAVHSIATNYAGNLLSARRRRESVPSAADRDLRRIFSAAFYSDPD